MDGDFSTCEQLCGRTLHRTAVIVQPRVLRAIDRNELSFLSSLISSDRANVIANRSFLRRAVQRGRLEVIAMLLDAGADIDAVDTEHCTGCHTAILNMRFDALKLLVERGAESRPS